MFSTITLGISIAGLIGLIVLKRFEERTGRLLLTSLRTRVGKYVHEGVERTRRDLPVASRRISTVARDMGREYAKQFLARSLLASEHWLERTLSHLRRVERAGRGGEASSFLKEVAEHKKQLVREREEPKE